MGHVASHAAQPTVHATDMGESNPEEGSSIPQLLPSRTLSDLWGRAEHPDHQGGLGLPHHPLQQQSCSELAQQVRTAFPSATQLVLSIWPQQEQQQQQYYNVQQQHLMRGAWPSLPPVMLDTEVAHGMMSADSGPGNSNSFGQPRHAQHGSSAHHQHPHQRHAPDPMGAHHPHQHGQAAEQVEEAHGLGQSCQVPAKRSHDNHVASQPPPAHRKDGATTSRRVKHVHGHAHSRHPHPTSNPASSKPATRRRLNPSTGTPRDVLGALRHMFHPGLSAVTLIGDIPPQLMGFHVDHGAAGGMPPADAHEAAGEPYPMLLDLERPSEAEGMADIEMVLAEGPSDALPSWQQGEENMAGPSGKALQKTLAVAGRRESLAGQAHHTPGSVRAPNGARMEDVGTCVPPNASDVHGSGSGGSSGIDAITTHSPDHPAKVPRLMTGPAKQQTGTTANTNVDAKITMAAEHREMCGGAGLDSRHEASGGGSGPVNRLKGSSGSGNVSGDSRERECRSGGSGGSGDDAQGGAGSGHAHGSGSGQHGSDGSGRAHGSGGSGQQGSGGGQDQGSGGIMSTKQSGQQSPPGPNGSAAAVGSGACHVSRDQHSDQQGSGSGHQGSKNGQQGSGGSDNNRAGGSGGSGASRQQRGSDEGGQAGRGSGNDSGGGHSGHGSGSTPGSGGHSLQETGTAACLGQDNSLPCSMAAPVNVAHHYGVLVDPRWVAAHGPELPTLHMMHSRASTSLNAAVGLLASHEGSASVAAAAAAGPGSRQEQLPSPTHVPPAAAAAATTAAAAATTAAASGAAAAAEPSLLPAAQAERQLVPLQQRVPDAAAKRFERAAISALPSPATCGHLLSALTLLRELRLWGLSSVPTPATLSTLTALSHLVTLDMRAVRPARLEQHDVMDPRHRRANALVTDAHIAVLGQLSTLTALYLNCVGSITGPGLAPLAQLRNLRTLCLSDALNAYQVQGRHLLPLVQLPRLVDLELGRAMQGPPPQHQAQQVNHAGAPDAAAMLPLAGVAAGGEESLWGSVLRHFTGLRMLSLQICHTLEKQLLSGVHMLDHLQALDLEGSDLPHRHVLLLLEGAAPLAALRRLKLSSLTLYDAHLRALARLTQLRGLVLQQVDVLTRDSCSWASLAPLTALQSFEFEEWNNPVLAVGNLAVLSDQSVAVMASSWRALEHLRYCGKVAITKQARDALASLPLLSELHIVGKDGTQCMGTRGRGGAAPSEAAVTNRADSGDGSGGANGRQGGGSNNGSGDEGGSNQGAGGANGVGGAVDMAGRTGVLRVPGATRGGAGHQASHHPAGAGNVVGGGSGNGNGTSGNAGGSGSAVPLQLRLLLPHAKLSSCNGYLTHSGTASLVGSQSSEESVNWNGGGGVLTGDSEEMEEGDPDEAQGAPPPNAATQQQRVQQGPGTDPDKATRDPMDTT